MTTVLPRSVGAQSVLSVSSTSITAQATAGTNAPSQTVRVTNAGKGALKWSVVQPSANWLAVSPTSGTNSGTLTLTFKTSALAVGGPYQTSFRVESSGSAATVNVEATILPATTPPPLNVTCPANISVTSSDGLPVVVNYTVSTSGGVAPVTVVGNPASGSSFPVATTTVQVTATSSDNQTAGCTFSVTVTSSAPVGTWTFCAPEGGFCSFSGTKQVRYGANGVYFTRTLTGGTSCTNSVFGDPIYGTVKHCDVEATPAPPLAVSCPANISVSTSGSSVPVSYTATTTGGTPPVTLTYTPPSGSSFSIGTSPVSVAASSSDGQTANCGFTVTVTSTPPPSSTAIGPQSTITCPAGSHDIFPGTNTIQTQVDLNPSNTPFCLRAGIHRITSSIVPKSGDAFIGEYGAILDGTGWTANLTTEAAFRAYLQNIDFVTVRNLVIRNMPQAGIHAFHQDADHWTIENNEIASNVTGVVFPSFSVLRNNYIHHNSSGGYLGASADNSTVDNNEIAYNGTEQKIGESANVTFTNNFVHHNARDGIWYDTNCTNALIEGNRVEDNGGAGIFYEISTDAIIRNNTVRRSGDAGVFVSTSKNVQVYNNIIDTNFRGITYFVNCQAVGGGTIPGGYDLASNTAHDNTITVGTQTEAFASVFSSTLCDSTQLEPYQNGSKNFTFSHNAYDVPAPFTGRYWFWIGLKFWSEWQALPQDVNSTVQ